MEQRLYLVEFEIWQEALSTEEKLKIVSLVQNGESIHSLWCETHIKERTILEWVRKYDLYGECGLHKQPNILATPEFKEEVVRLIIENLYICKN